MTDYVFQVFGYFSTACVPGYFTFGGRNNCTLCPANSTTDDVAASQCHCIQDYYRVDDDTMSGPCNSLIETNFEACTGIINNTYRSTRAIDHTPMHSHRHYYYTIIVKMYWHTLSP